MPTRAMRLLFPAMIGVAAVVAAHPPLNGQSSASGEKVLLGTWRLDLTKSKYFPGPAPLRETRIYTADKDGVLGAINRVYADGHAEIIEYRANYDHEQMVTGTPAYRCNQAQEDRQLHVGVNPLARWNDIRNGPARDLA